MTIQVPVEQKVLSENQRIATGLRSVLEATGRLSLNFIGSPGAGKTAFLERTLGMLPAGTRVEQGPDERGDGRTRQPHVKKRPQVVVRRGVVKKIIHRAAERHQRHHQRAADLGVADALLRLVVIEGGHDFRIGVGHGFIHGQVSALQNKCSRRWGRISPRTNQRRRRPVSTPSNRRCGDKTNAIP